MRALLLGLTMITAISGVVQADVMSSGAAYGGSTQAVAVCYIFNGGTTNLTVTKVDIIKEPFGEIVPVVTQNCNGGVFTPGRICRTVSNINNANVVACRATLSPKGIARGSMEIRTSGNAPLNNRDLR